MSKRITTAFTNKKNALLIPYIPVCWPNVNSTCSIMLAMEKNGAGLIEVGIPFSDPAADGPILQVVSEQAIANGSSLDKAFEAVQSYRDQGGSLPVVLMGYANPFLRYGIKALTESCLKCGIDGVLAVDWPPQKGDDIDTAFKDQDIARILLVAPTTTDVRLTQIASFASGYSYYVSMQGVTGNSILDTKNTAQVAERVRKLIKLPVAIGFGVRTVEDCARLGQDFDAVIVGTKLVEVIKDSKESADISAGKLIEEFANKLT